MAAQTQENQYEVIVYDYDPAPDAQCYGIYEFKRFPSLDRAKNYAYWAVNGEASFVGAAVFREGEMLDSFGFIPRQN